MRLALCGMPMSGKSTIFAALTSRQIPETRGRDESNQALLRVPDDRVDRFRRSTIPRKPFMRRSTMSIRPRPRKNPTIPQPAFRPI